MKKETKKIIKKAMTIEDLALLTQRGFEGLEQRMREDIRREISSVKTEFTGEISSVKDGQEGLRQEIFSVKEEQKIQGRQITSIERKLGGTLLSLDETVHRSEFNELVHRVEVLEA